VYCVCQIIVFIKERMAKTNTQDHEIVILVTHSSLYCLVQYNAASCCYTWQVNVDESSLMTLLLVCLTTSFDVEAKCVEFLFSFHWCSMFCEVDDLNVVLSSMALHTSVSQHL